VWRGQLGAHLKNLDTDARHQHDVSLYKQLFRTPRAAVHLPDLPKSQLGRLGLAGEHVPHPFVVRLAEPTRLGEDLDLKPGSLLEVELVCLGHAVRHIPALTGVLDQIGARGLGRKVSQPKGGGHRRGRTRLQQAVLQIGSVALNLYQQGTWTLPPRCDYSLYERAEMLSASTGAPRSSSEIQLYFETPTRLKHRGDIVRPEALSLAALAQNAFRRTLSLALCYGKAPSRVNAVRASDIEAWQSALWTLTETTTAHTTDLRWVQDSRYSHRQQQRHPVSGLVGSVKLEGPPETLQGWWALLRRAAPLHLGKNTSMGNGRVRVQ